MDRLHKHANIFGAAALILVLGLIVGGSYIKTRQEPSVIPYGEFIQWVEAGQVESVSLSDDSYLFFTCPERDILYQTDNPRKAELKEMLLLQGVSVAESDSATGDSLMQLGFSLILFAGVLYAVQHRKSRYAFKSGLPNSPVTADTKGKLYRFDDVAGNAEAKESVADIVDFLSNPEKYARYGARMPKGVIFHGLPGTGKTLMAKAIAGEANVPFYAVSGSDFVQMYVGVGAARVRELFKKAREAGKAVIFIDEIDALGKKRSDQPNGGNDEREQTLNALLTEMSGFSDKEGIVVIAATNRVDMLDEALMRPGRFDRKVEIAMPDLNARKQILALHAQNKPLSEEADLEKVARETVFFSGAMLENLLNEAAIFAAKRGTESITPEDIDKAYYVSLAGREKQDRGFFFQQERRVTAYHEAGHALAAKLTGSGNTVSKITIVPSSSGAGGFCVNIPPERMYYTKKELEAQIMVHIAGRGAEELIFGSEQVTTGASNDIEKATQTARQYIARFGMGKRTGLIDLTHTRGNGIVLKECGRLIQRLYTDTQQLLSDNRDLLEAIATALLEKETLREEELNEIMAYARCS